MRESNGGEVASHGVRGPGQACQPGAKIQRERANARGSSKICKVVNYRGKSGNKDIDGEKQFLDNT